MTGQGQRPAGAGFLGAQRATSYFEEWPTEVGGNLQGVGRENLSHVPQMGDMTEILETKPESEARLRAVTRVTSAEAPTLSAPSASATQAVAVTHAEPAQPAQSRQSWLRALFNSPSPARVAAEQLGADQTAIRSGAWGSSLGVLVANPKGGTGKTPSAIALGGVFASIRGGQTVVYEVTDDPGALSIRAEGSARVGISELIRDADSIRGAGQLTSYIAQQTSYAAVVASAADREPLDAAAVQLASDLLGFFFPVRIMDSGNQPSSSAFHGAISRAHVLVVPVMEATDSLAAAHQMLRSLTRLGGHASDLARRAIILRISDTRTPSRGTRTLVTDSLAATAVADVVEIPWDPHIAQRSTITFDRLRPATVQAYTRAAAAIVHQLNGR